MASNIVASSARFQPGDDELRVRWGMARGADRLRRLRGELKCDHGGVRELIY